MSEQTVKELPLQGKRILITRAHEQSATFRSRLSALGALPVVFPTIRVVAPDDWEPLDTALRLLHETECYDWLVFTSANGVRICFERMLKLGYSVRSFGDVRIAAIGPATASTVTKNGAKVDLVPTQYIAEAVASSMIDYAHKQGESLKGKRILLARAAEARNALITELQREGAKVDVVAAYRTIGVANGDERGSKLLDMLEAQQLHILTFTSSSTVRNFMHWLSQFNGTFYETFISSVVENGWPKIACIGPITSQTAHEFGLPVHIEAQEYTITGLIEAIIRNEGKS